VGEGQAIQESCVIETRRCVSEFSPTSSSASMSERIPGSPQALGICSGAYAHPDQLGVSGPVPSSSSHIAVSEGLVQISCLSNPVITTEVAGSAHRANTLRTSRIRALFHANLRLPANSIANLQVVGVSFGPKGSNPHAQQTRQSQLGAAYAARFDPLHGI